MLQRYQDTQKSLQELQKRIDQLEQAKMMHLPNGYTDKLLDLAANLNYNEIDLEADLERTRTTKKILFSILNANKRK